MSGSLRDPRVAGLLITEAISSVGSWASLFAIWGYAAFEFDAGPTDLSMFGIAFGAPGVAFGPIAGMVIDRLGPKATLAGAKVLGIVASLLLLTADDFTSLAILSALHGIASTFSHPAIQSMPPRLVADEHLARTNALVSLTDELAIVFGPVAAGVSIAVVGFHGAFAFDAITYAVGLVALPMVRLRPPVADPDAATDDGSILDGWHRIMKVPVLRRTVGCTAVVHLLYGAALLVEPLYVRDVLGRSEEVFAALQALFGIMLISGGLAVAKLGERLVSLRTVVAGTVLSALAAIVYLGTSVLAIAVVGACMWGLATAAMGGPSRTVIQRASPETEHGRVLAADHLAGSVAELAGLASLGVLIDTIGLRGSVFLLGLAVAGVATTLGAADRRDRRPPTVAIVHLDPRPAPMVEDSRP